MQKHRYTLSSLTLTIRHDQGEIRSKTDDLMCFPRLEGFEFQLLNVRLLITISNIKKPNNSLIHQMEYLVSKNRDPFSIYKNLHKAFTIYT